MVPARRFLDGVSPATTWSIGAGFYLFVWATAVAYLLSDVLILFGAVIGLPAGAALVVLAVPSLVIGTISWWAVVERPGAYAYRRGVLVGLLTAALTGLVWVGRFVGVWGVELIAVEAVAILAAVVLGVAAAVGALVGLPLMYARRRLDGPTSSAVR